MSGLQSDYGICRTQEEVDKFIDKFQVYAISDQVSAIPEKSFESLLR